MIEGSYLDEALYATAKKGRFSPEGDIKYGWNKKSAGIKVSRNDQAYWLRLQFRPKNENADKLWLGELEARVITGIKKPILIESIEWEDPDWVFRGDVLEFVPFKVCSATSHLTFDIDLSENWYEDLKLSLTRLQTVSTERINTRQDLITRRIQERFGTDIDTKIKKWITVHGDLHWGNLTMPKCYILDWEAWGKGPVGLDPSFLYCFSLLEPKVANSVYSNYEEELESRDGVVSQMFACAELLRMIELHNDHPELLDPLLSFFEKLKNKI